MKLVFLTNYINHHQVYLADEFYSKLKGDYYFVATSDIPQERKKLGYPDFSDRPYLVKAYESIEKYNYAQDLTRDADVVIVGSAPESMVTDRIRSGKLTFRYNERWYKSRPWFLNTPRGWLNIFRNHIQHRDKPLYMLCASAYTSVDVNKLGLYLNKCYRWGYFTKVDDIDDVIKEKLFLTTSNPIRIIWCARFLDWKHPELAVKLAERLKNNGYNFVIDMFGCGEELYTTIKYAKKKNLSDVICFHGSKPNDEILSEMRKHDIFIFTSDKNEGWGAVLNEAMSNGCAVVGSNEIGAVPFLIEDGVNGLIFKSRDLDSLEKEVVYLIEHPNERARMVKNAYRTMREVWSPENAAKQFLQLVEALKSNDESLIPSYGPGSKI